MLKREISYKDIMGFAVTLPVMVLLTLFVRYTSLGKAMRATAQNPTAAQLMGINVDRVIAATFAIVPATASRRGNNRSIQRPTRIPGFSIR